MTLILLRFITSDHQSIFKENDTLPKPSLNPRNSINHNHDRNLCQKFSIQLGIICHSLSFTTPNIIPKSAFLKMTINFDHFNGFIGSGINVVYQSLKALKRLKSNDRKDLIQNGFKASSLRYFSIISFTKNVN